MQKGRRNIGVAGATIGLAVLGGLLLTGGLIVSRSDFRPGEEPDRFPTVTGNNLDRELVEFPRDFGGDLNLLFIPFLQQQQRVVDTWVPFARELEATYPGTIYYELPTIEDMGTLGRTFVNEGMRAGIPDPVSRQRTVTLYLDLAAFMRSLDITSRNDVHVLLVTNAGDILWRTTGPYSPDTADQLLQVVADNRP